MSLAITVPRLTGPVANLLSGAAGLALILVTLTVVLVGGWAWETDQRWFTRNVMRWWRFGLVPLLVLGSAVTTVVRLFALA